MTHCTKASRCTGQRSSTPSAWATDARQRIGGRRRDAVDHRAREEHFALDPAREAASARARELRACARASFTPLSTRLSQLTTANGATPAARRRLRALRWRNPTTLPGARGFCRSRSNIRMRQIECAIAREAVALLGHRDCDDVSGRRAKSLQDRLGTLGRDQQLADRTDHFAGDRSRREPRSCTGCPAGRGRPAHPGCAATRAQIPQRGSCASRLSMNQRLVHAMKRAGAEVHDAGAELVAVVLRCRERRRAGGPANARSTDSVTGSRHSSRGKSHVRRSLHCGPARPMPLRARAAAALRPRPASSCRRARCPHRSRSSDPSSARAELEEILSVGTGNPSGVPRPVVNSSTVAPARDECRGRHRIVARRFEQREAGERGAFAVSQNLR